MEPTIFWVCAASRQGTLKRGPKSRWMTGADQRRTANQKSKKKRAQGEEPARTRAGGSVVALQKNLNIFAMEDIFFLTGALKWMTLIPILLLVKAVP